MPVRRASLFLHNRRMNHDLICECYAYFIQRYFRRDSPVPFKSKLLAKIYVDGLCHLMSLACTHKHMFFLSYLPVSRFIYRINSNQVEPFVKYT